MLSAHPDISTASEPWILLPLAHMLLPRDVYALYDHSVAAPAIQEFAKSLPGGIMDLEAKIADFAISTYSAAAGQSRYFLDKSPRYCLIAERLIRILPNAKYILLFRNPLAVMASMIDHWGHVNRNRQDLFDGLLNLRAARASLSENCVVVRYEDLVLDPHVDLKAICDYLDLEFTPSMIEDFGKVRLHGDLGDHSSLEHISRDPITKWQTTLRRNPVRFGMALAYLRWIGPEVLNDLGYGFADLRLGLGRPRLSTRSLVTDTKNWVLGLISSLLEPIILRDKLRAIKAGSRIYPHR